MAAANSSSQPLQEIVDTKKNKDGELINKLACGHTMPARDLPKERQPDRRRCPSCPAEEGAAKPKKTVKREAKAKASSKSARPVAKPKAGKKRPAIKERPAVRHVGGAKPEPVSATA
jgi:hypothetical protein